MFGFSLQALVSRRLTLVVLLLLIFLTFIFYLLSSNVHAQSACSEPDSPLSAKEAVDQLNRCSIEKDVFDDKIFNLNQIMGTSDSLYIMLLGTSTLHPETNAATQGGGALAASGKLVASLYAHPPVSGVDYFAYQFKKLNPIQPVYAQTGIGYQALSPVAEIWRVFRNISYIGFVIVFVITGFMIMFRARISPQAVATVQDSIPRIIVALALVTFSYAIAGLMIDFMFLIMNITINFLAQAGLLDATKANVIFEKNIFGIIWGSWREIFATVANSISEIVKDAVDLGFLGNFVIKSFGGTIVGLIVGIALIFVMFRIFLALLNAYVMIIILTAAAPFFFLIQALPGNSGASSWFRQLASNISAFPVTALVLLFAAVLGGISNLGATSDQSAITSGDVGRFPLLVGGLDVSLIGKLIGIGLILITPEVITLVKNAISSGGRGGGGGGGGFAPAAAIGASLGAAGGYALGGAGKGYQAAAGILPSGFNPRTGEGPRSKLRFVNPAYWKQRSANANIGREEVGRKVAERRATRTTPGSDQGGGSA